MDRYKKVLLGCTILTTLSSPAFADEFDPFVEFLVFGGIASLDAGDSTIRITSQETDQLVQTNENDWKAWTGQVGLGYVAQFAEELSSGEVDWFPIINPQINVYYLGGEDIEGDVWRFQDPNFNQADYSMKFHSTRLMFDLALTIAQIERLSIYAIGGLGIAWNEIDFNARSTEVCPIEDVSLNSNNDNSFAYEFGGGLTYAAFDSMAISLEYLYTGFNNIGLGDHNDDVNDQGLDVKASDIDIHSQAVLLGLRFAL